MDNIFLGEFAYPGLSKNYPGCCGLSVWRDASRYYAVVIASELPSNPGASITNAYEYLASRVVRQLHPQVPPWGTLWFEHYPPGLGIEAQDHYDMVTFGLVERRNGVAITYHHPSWRRVTRGFVAEAVGVTDEAWLIPWETAPDTPTQCAFATELLQLAPSAISGIHSTN